MPTAGPTLTPSNPEKALSSSPQANSQAGSGGVGQDRLSGVGGGSQDEAERLQIATEQAALDVQMHMRLRDDAVRRWVKDGDFTDAGEADRQLQLAQQAAEYQAALQRRNG